MTWIRWARGVGFSGVWLAGGEAGGGSLDNERGLLGNGFQKWFRVPGSYSSLLLGGDTR